MPFEDFSDEEIEKMAERQRKARRAVYSSQYNAEKDRIVEENIFKSKLLGLLEKDRDFRRKIKKIINSGD